jgi:hypothetical protein
MGYTSEGGTLDERRDTHSGCPFIRVVLHEEDRVMRRIIGMAVPQWLKLVASLVHGGSRKAPTYTKSASCMSEDVVSYARAIFI